MTSASACHLAKRRRGLTLVELVVVMAILVALAGIILPLMPGIIGRAETSSRATNDGEIYKWIQMYEATTSAYPYDWDALVDSSNTQIGYVSGFTGATAPLAVTTVTGPQVSALTSAGIVRLQLMLQKGSTSTTNTTSSYSDTFNPYPTLNDRIADGLPLTGGTAQQLVTLTLQGQAQLGLVDNASGPATGVYVVFGFGKRCSLIGTGSTNAPVNFFDKFSLDPSPNASYGRYGVVFQVNGINGINAAPVTASTTLIDFSRAKFVKVFRFGGTLTTGDDAIKSYWDDVSSVSGS